jgi:hypothetical protein
MPSSAGAGGRPGGARGGPREPRGVLGGCLGALGGPSGGPNALLGYFLRALFSSFSGLFFGPFLVPVLARPGGRPRPSLGPSGAPGGPMVKKPCKNKGFLMFCTCGPDALGAPRGGPAAPGSVQGFPGAPGGGHLGAILVSFLVSFSGRASPRRVFFAPRPPRSRTVIFVFLARPRARPRPGRCSKNL